MKGRELLVALLSGLLFGAGLTLSGMTQPGKVIGFLDVAGRWDPSLMAVMAGAIAAHAGVARWVRRRGKPLLAERLALPAATNIDRRLVVGSALFGAGWGLAGYCPGPALVALGTGSAGAVSFVLAMGAAWWATARAEAWWGARRAGADYEVPLPSR